MAEKISKEKIKAMDRLIFLVRVSEKKNTEKGTQDLRMGFEAIAKELDKLGIPMWKQNYITMLAKDTNLYMTDIIKKVYYLKKPSDFKRK